MDERMQELIERLNAASKAYYDGNDAVISDDEWDAMYAELRKLEEETGVRLENSMLNDMPEVDSSVLNAELEKKWASIAALRDRVNRSLEEARAAKTIGKSLEAAVKISANGDCYDFICGIEDLSKLFIVSTVEVEKKDSLGASLEDIEVEIAVAGGVKCPRCWTFSTEAGTDAEHPELCPRCTAAVKGC